jgi:hypothetical protein
MIGPHRWVSELKRRKVVRVAAVYAATGFAVLQGADLILPRSSSTPRTTCTPTTGISDATTRGEVR